MRNNQIPITTNRNNNQAPITNNQTNSNDQKMNNNQVPSTKFQTIINDQNSNVLNKKQHRFDLEERSFRFAKNCRDYVKKIFI